MQKKFTIPMLAAIVGMVLAVVSIAFTTPRVKATKGDAITSFEFLGDADDYSQYKLAANWQVVTSDPGCAGTDYTCVLETGSYSNPTDLAAEISSLGMSNGLTFVHNNTTSQKSN